MFGINGGELLVLIVIAIVVVGPERMPEYARQLREWALGLRGAVDKGRAQLKAEVGDDVDWDKLDPRQYDPRRIVREALYEPTPAPAPARTAPAPAGQPAPFDADAT
ncbi:twin-arginine translocase TatA/TatE family subunit [Demequina sp. SO4-18]|uniref:twin-arginine translocase TatA/TatE family subunit n=1 Tax=Demequina sp. SO4-18 TaxID=3401026 RepID=UPI003B5C4B04